MVELLKDGKSAGFMSWFHELCMVMVSWLRMVHKVHKVVDGE